MREYKPKPFTKEISNQMKLNINSPFDQKRTLCNVLKLAYRCSKEESYNLEAVRALLLEGFWMGQRMSAKLSSDKKSEFNNEHVEQAEEDPSSVDWSNISSPNVARGNWD